MALSLTKISALLSAWAPNELEVDSEGRPVGRGGWPLLDPGYMGLASPKHEPTEEVEEGSPEEPREGLSLIHI